MLAVIAGVYLRLCGLSTQQIFADEIHGLEEAASHGYAHIFTHFTQYDACIPLTLYNRWIMDRVGLNEVLFHLPSAFCGCATLFLLAWMAWKWLGPLTALLAGGLLAISPFHVYLSREARPYPIVIFLLTLATERVLAWSETGAPSALAIAALASFGALYFHLISLAAVICLFAFVGWKASLRLRAADARTVRNCALLFGVLCAAFLLPALPSLLRSVHGKVAQGRPEFAAMRYGLYLALAVPDALIAELALAAWGVRALVKVRKEAALLLTILLLWQVTFVCLSAPVYVEIPWVWMRYVGVLLPFWFLLVAGGIIDLAQRIPLRAAAPALAVLLLLAIGLYDGKGGLYPLGQNRNFNVHPMVMAHDLGRSTVLASLPSTPFYQRLRDEGAQGGILELPFVMVFPVYDLYQRVHHDPVFSGAVGTGTWQELFNRKGEFRFRRMVDLRDQNALAALPVKYVVIHKHPEMEVADVYRGLLAIQTERHLLTGFDWMFAPDNLERLFGDGSALRDWAASRFGPPVYEDAVVAVYAMSSLGMQGGVSKPASQSGLSLKRNPVRRIAAGAR